MSEKKKKGMVKGTKAAEKTESNSTVEPFVASIGPDEIIIHGNFDWKNARETIEELWMGFKKKYKNDYDVCIAMTFARRKKNSGTIALKFIADFRVPEPEWWVERIIDEFANALAKLFTTNPAAVMAV